MSELGALTDDELLKSIDAAAKTANESESLVAAAQAARIEKCKAVGYPLLELHRRYPKVKDFEAKLKQCPNITVKGLSTAYEFMKLVGGRKTDEDIAKAIKEHKEAAKVRKRKSRAALPPQPKPLPQPKPFVTSHQCHRKSAALGRRSRR
jgi:hypothetical protein